MNALEHSEMLLLGPELARNVGAMPAFEIAKRLRRAGVKRVTSAADIGELAQGG